MDSSTSVARCDSLRLKFDTPTQLNGGVQREEKEEVC